MKTVALIGATSDIARAVAAEFAEHGWSLLLMGRSQEALERLAQDFRIRYDVTVTTQQVDVEDIPSHSAAVDTLTRLPEVVVCAAGYLGSQERTQSDEQEAYKTLTVNFTGSVSLLNQFAERFIQRGNGTVIGISSVAGERGREKNYFYGSAKAGFTAYLSGLRQRASKQGVHVITVLPGFVRTAMTDGMDLPPLLTAEPAETARDIYKAFTKKKNVVYTKWMWRYIMIIIRALPESLFKKLSL